MTGFASAQAAFETPPGDGPDLIDCPDCEGKGGLTECANDGTHGCSHTFDREWTCTTCDGEGQIDPRDHRSWCDRCGMSGRCPDCDPRDQDDDR